MRMIGPTSGGTAGLPGVSVIICCYNSAERLPETLSHLAAQAGASSVPWEVVVIDNASLDATAAVARQSWPENGPAPLRVVNEPMPGLTHARHRGLRESRFGFLSFIDDDNWVSPSWVADVFRVLSTHPEVAACGGRGEPVLELEKAPELFSVFASAYAVGPQAETEGYVARARSILYGAGLSVRKSAWTALISQGFRPALSDRKGKSLSSGGDSELCMALVLAGWKLWYDPSLTFKHYLPTERLQWDYLRRLNRSFGTAVVWMEQYKTLIDPPASVSFRSIPLPDGMCAAIRGSWLFQVYATLRTLVARSRSARLRSGNCTEGDAECLRSEWEASRAACLLKSFLVYDRRFSQLKRAGWATAGSDGNMSAEALTPSV
jgi:glycosyltransferase involved in cell wall biosynthesis